MKWTATIRNLTFIDGQKPATPTTATKKSIMAIIKSVTVEDLKWQSPKPSLLVVVKRWPLKVAETATTPLKTKNKNKNPYSGGRTTVVVGFIMMVELRP